MRLIQLGGVLIATTLCACTQPRRLEFDLSGVAEFQWDGRVRLTSEYKGLLAGWQMTQLDVLGDQDRTVTLSTNRGESPIVRLTSPHGEGAQATVAVRSRPSGAGVLLGTRCWTVDVAWTATQDAE